MKFTSSKLKSLNYKIEIDFETARHNNEIVNLAESELLRQYRKIMNINFSYDETRELIRQKNKLNKDKNKKSNREQINKLQKQIDEILFIENIVIVKFDNIAHYRKIIKDGLFINNKKFIRLLCPAGQARKSTVTLAEKNIANQLSEIFDAGRNLDTELVMGKFTSYQALFSSSTQSVSTPKFCVIPDFKYKKERLVDFVFEKKNGENDVEERLLEIESTPFDGQGLCSPELAKKWSDELGLGWTPNSFGVRAPYLKGQLVVFPFHEFAKEKNVYKVIDVYGNEWDINDLDAIVTASQFKLWQSYNNFQDYLNACNKNDFKWGISKYTPKQEKTHFWTSYQYAQVLDLNDKQIEELCKPTLEYIKSITSDNPINSILYLMGNVESKDVDQHFLDNIEDKILKALLIDKSVINDNHIKNILFRKINKIIRESYHSSLLVDGNYQVAISDPSAQCEFALGLEIKGLLAENEHYSSYWNNKGIQEVVAMRSPLTFKSEVVKLNLKNNDNLEKWFGQLKSGIVYNIWGNDTMLQADSDFDFDIIATTDNKQFLDGRSGGLPITYEKKNAPKSKINNNELFKADVNSFGTKVGLVTNFSTTMFGMLSLYDKDSIEYNELYKRLKICRMLQGQAIDKQKGIEVRPIPEWSKYHHIKSNMSEEEKHEIELHNKLLLDRRPLWMIYLYQHKMNEHKKFNRIYENFCQSKLGFSLEILLSKERNKKEEDIYRSYVKYSPFLVEDKSIMMKIYKYMTQSIREHKLKMKQDDFNYSIYIDKSIPKNSYRLQQMKDLLREYKSAKKNLHTTNNFENKEQIYSLLRGKAEFNISSNISELANLAVYCTYENGTISSRQFVFDLFSDGIIQNLLTNSNSHATIPVLDSYGKIEFLGKKYSEKEIEVKTENV